MDSVQNETIRAIAQRLLANRIGAASEKSALLSAARSAHDDLGTVLTPLIGEAGFNAISSRALHLAKREFQGEPPENESQGTPTHDPFIGWLKRFDPPRITEPAVAMLSSLGVLLSTFIGEPLTMRLLRNAWPDGFSGADEEETHA